MSEGWADGQGLDGREGLKRTGGIRRMGRVGEVRRYKGKGWRGRGGGEKKLLFAKRAYIQLYQRFTRSIKHNNNNNNNKYFYSRECFLYIHLFSIRPSTQHRLTTITTWFNNNNK